MRGITPYLQVKRTGDAIAWYERVFGAQEVRARLVAPEGICMNAESAVSKSGLSVDTGICIRSCFISINRS